jgi:hypothetical protein
VNKVRWSHVLVLGMALGACAPAGLMCRPGERTVETDTLHFGTAKQDLPVSDEEWQDFLKVTVTPRFPQGFTTWDAAGQWRGEKGKILRETTHILYLANLGANDNAAAILEIISQYKQHFQQEAVLQVHSQACVSY